MFLVDTHIHLRAPEWQQPVAERMAVARQSGIQMLLQPGVRASDWQHLIALSKEYPEVYAAPGIHPMSAADWNDSVAARLGELCDCPQVLAVGEIGLDAQLEVDLRLQEYAFRAQVEMAVAAGLPVLIHCRQKTAVVLDILRISGIDQVGGIWHGFSGSLETARQIIDLGLLLGIGPVLLRKNARKLPEVVKAVSGDMLVLETDAPDMAAGPEVLVAVAERLAELRGWTWEETTGITTMNARRILQQQD